jgi:hypothetical protein
MIPCDNIIENPVTVRNQQRDYPAPVVGNINPHSIAVFKGIQPNLPAIYLCFKILRKRQRLLQASFYQTDNYSL